jgi:hypothetical protein
MDTIDLMKEQISLLKERITLQKTQLTILETKYATLEKRFKILQTKYNDETHDDQLCKACDDGKYEECWCDKMCCSSEGIFYHSKDEEYCEGCKP